MCQQQHLLHNQCTSCSIWPHCFLFRCGNILNTKALKPHVHNTQRCEHNFCTHNKKQVIWKTIDDTKLDNFPEFTKDELRDLTMVNRSIPTRMITLTKRDHMRKLHTKKMTMFSKHRYVLVTHQIKDITCGLNTLKG